MDCCVAREIEVSAKSSAEDQQARVVQGSDGAENQEDAPTTEEATRADFRRNGCVRD